MLVLFVGLRVCGTASSIDNVCAVYDHSSHRAEPFDVFKILRGHGQCTSGEITAEGMSCNKAHCKGAPGTTRCAWAQKAIPRS
jgi:hypothetical protein